MKSLVALGCLMVLASSSPAAEEVTFRGRVPAPGSTRTVIFKEHGVQRGVIGADQKVDWSRQNAVYTFKRLEDRVVASTAEGVTRIEGYCQVSEKFGNTRNDVPLREKTFRDGQNYAVELKDGKVEVENINGLPFPPGGAAAYEIASDYPAVGRSSPLVAALGGKRLKVGVALDVPASTLLGFLEEMGEAVPLVGSMTVALKTVGQTGGRKTATLEIEARMAVPAQDPVPATSGTLRGDLVVAVDELRPLSFHADVAFETAEEIEKHEVGSWRIEKTWEYTEAAEPRG